jgi:hypothetical protein
MKEGVSAFEQLQSPISRFLVRSRFMRALYGTVKAAAAGFLTLFYALRSTGSSCTSLIYLLAVAFTWISVIVCVLRGLPVLSEGIKSIRS